MLALTLSSCTEVLQSRGQNKGWLMALPPARCGRLARPVALQSNSPSVSLSNRDLGKKPRARTCRGKGSEGIRPPGQRPRRSRAPEPNSTCDAGPKGQCPAVARRGRPSPRGGGREESRDTQSARGRALGGRCGGGAGREARPPGRRQPARGNAPHGEPARKRKQSQVWGLAAAEPASQTAELEPELVLLQKGWSRAPRLRKAKLNYKLAWSSALRSTAVCVQKPSLRMLRQHCGP